MATNNEIIIIILLSLCFGSLGGWLISRYGDQYGLTDIPIERSSHSKVTPKGGGIGILISFIFFSLYFSLYSFLWIPTSVLSLISFFGDRYQISPKFRLFVQFVCSLVVLAGLFYSNRFSPLVYLLILPVSVFIVGTTNFYNFMDGINGISGLTAIVAFGFLGYFGFLTGVEEKYIFFCGIIVFSNIGFLPFNFPLAKVFMGDIGSIMLGFLFACFVILFSKNLLDFMILCSFLLMFYIDELSTIVVRLKNNDQMTTPHRKHLYQLLVNEFGMKHWKVSLIYIIFQIIISASVLLVRNNIYFVFLLILCYSISFCLWSYIVRRRNIEMHIKGMSTHEN